MPNDEAHTPTPDDIRTIADILSSYSVSSTGLDHYVAQLRQLADQPERNAEVQWQPIDTAPKDGTKMLLAWPGIVNMGRRDVNGFYAINSATYFRPEQPTNWMPIPAPPEDKC